MGILSLMHLTTCLAALFLLVLSCQVEAKFFSIYESSNESSVSFSSFSSSNDSSSSSNEVNGNHLKSKKPRRDDRSIWEKMVGYPREREYGRDGQVKPRPDLPSDASENEDFCTIM